MKPPEDHESQWDRGLGKLSKSQLRNIKYLRVAIQHLGCRSKLVRHDDEFMFSVIYKTEDWEKVRSVLLTIASNMPPDVLSSLNER